ncbi:hypothetical protein ACHAXT_006619 [Thalassiosira profunda]
MVVTSAADERQHRIHAFKDRVAALRATSKVYAVENDRSINTLDSSTVASSVCGSAATADSSHAGVGARGAPLRATELLRSRSRSPEKRSPQESTPPRQSADHRAAVELSESSDSDVATGGQGVAASCNPRTNPFFDSDSEASSEEDAGEEGGLLVPFRQAPAERDEPPAKEDAESEDEEETRPPVTTIGRQLSLEQKVGGTGRPDLAGRASSGGAASAISSAGTLSTFGGFSIESIQESTGSSRISGGSKCDEKNKQGTSTGGMLRTWSQGAPAVVKQADATLQWSKLATATTAVPITPKSPMEEEAKQKSPQTGTPSNLFEDDSEASEDEWKNPFEETTEGQNPFEDDIEAKNPFVETSTPKDKSNPFEEDSLSSLGSSHKPFTKVAKEHQLDIDKTAKLENMLNEGWNLLADMEASRSQTPAREVYDLSAGAKVASEEVAKDDVQVMDSQSSSVDALLADLSSSKESSKKDGPVTKWLASRVAPRPALNTSQEESVSTTDILLADSSLASSSQDTSTPKSNPFADLLRQRQARKMELLRRVNQSVGSMNMEASSDGASMSSASEGTELKKRVFCYGEDDKGSADGALFSDLGQALSKIQSVSMEEDTEGDEEKHKEAVERIVEHDRPSDMKSQIVLKKGAESCGVSSMKDSHAFGKLDLFELNDDDDASGVMSVPKSPAPLEIGKEGATQQAHLLVQDDHSEGEDGGDSVTVTCSNSKKANSATDQARETTLTPPKKGVVINDGSISTKDSILGWTINVTNKDLAAERIYLESLRAQVLAELKVHVADEEIRLALDARLSAIQDYYKRKSTTIHLQPVAGARAAPLDGIFFNSLGDLPKVKPTVIAQSTSLKDHAATVGLSDNPNSGPSSPIQPRKKSSLIQERQDTHRFALERVQGKIDEALQAAHNASPKESRCEEDEEEKRPEEEEVGPNCNRQATETPIPQHIFTNDTFWDDEDDPAQITPATPGSQQEHVPMTKMGTMENAWAYYRTINALIFDSRVYDYEFQVVQEDPLYPYLNSLVGIADSGEDGYANEHKRISQMAKKEYADLTPHRICHTLAKEANDALPGLKTVCGYIGNKLGMQTMAVGPMKKPSEALLKCERKYGGDPLLVTDYCRASLFVKDVASLLALVEIVLSKYAAIVRRIKLSSMKSDHHPLVGGYRDVKINLDIDGHICEIQVHLISMWLIKEGYGYAHYKQCCENNVDVSTFDIGRTLSGLKRKTLKDLSKVGENALLKRHPIVSVQQYNEDVIRDYFALANVYLCRGSPAKAEIILRRLVKLRSESGDFGPLHAETLIHMELLRKSLKCQHRYKSASSVTNQISKAKKIQRERAHDDPTLEEMWENNHCGAMDHVCDLLLDPAKKERQEEKRKADTVEKSRALWLTVRRSFFS